MTVPGLCISPLYMYFITYSSRQPYDETEKSGRDGGNSHFPNEKPEVYQDQAIDPKKVIAVYGSSVKNKSALKRQGKKANLRDK